MTNESPVRPTAATAAMMTAMPMRLTVKRPTGVGSMNGTPTTSVSSTRKR